MTIHATDPVIRPEHVDVLLRAGGLAPSLHNSQPWQFAVGSRHVEVYADASQQLRSSDPSGRSLLISCGAAVFNLRVAFAHLGLLPRPRLLPDPADPTLVATLEVEGQQRPDDLGRFYNALFARRTNRRPFQDRNPPRWVLTSLTDAARTEGAVLNVFDDPEEVARVVGLLRDADIVDRTEPSRIDERARWVGEHRRESTAGIPSDSLGPRPSRLDTAFRDLGPAGVPRDHATFENAPILAVLDQVRPTSRLDSGGPGLGTRTPGGDCGWAIGFVHEPAPRAG